MIGSGVIMDKVIKGWGADLVSKLQNKNYLGADVQVFNQMPSNVYQTLRDSADEYPGKLALWEEGRELSFSGLLNRVDHLAASFRDIGIRKGDRVALLMTNSIDFCLAFYANAKLGAVSLPVSSKFKSSELQFPLSDSEAEVLICDAKWWPNVAPIINSLKIRTVIFTDEVQDTGKNGINKYRIGDLIRAGETLPKSESDAEPVDTVLVMYTSGTTGRPKGAIISHYNLLHAIISYKEIFDISEKDRTIISIPIFHITGLCALMALFIYAGGTSYLLPYFDAEKTLEIAREKRITFFHASPTIYILLLQASRDIQEFKSVRRCAAGSANMPEDILRQLHEKLPEMSFHAVYGLTETSSPATIMPVNVITSSKTKSCGIPIPGVRVRIMGDRGRECGPNEVGEVQLTGTVVIRQYFKNAYATQNSFEAGWFKTGDLGYMDEDGYLYIVDRKKDMINRGGEKIYSIEVENILYTHEDVVEAAVIGRPDAVYGEVVMAVVKLREDSPVREADLIEYCRGRLSSYKVPREISFVDELPHTESGKISKRMVREQIGGGR